MIWRNHHELEGTHAFLGASNHHWINYDEETLVERYCGKFATDIGTAIHNLAKDCISNRIKIKKSDKNLIDLELYRCGIPRKVYDSGLVLDNLIPFVNDAIGFHMDPEVLLYYSPYCYGTTDAISYNEKTKTLRIHDLKTGVTKTHMEQLKIYAALFCLEYNKKPADLNFVLRIYQNMDIIEEIPEPHDIEKFCEIIKAQSKEVDNFIEA